MNDPQVAGASWRWTPRRQQAASMLARGDSQTAVAQAVGVSNNSVSTWMQHPEFRAAVDAETEQIRAAIRAEGIANLQNRVDFANERHELLRQVIAERAVDPALQHIPGGKTGLIVASPVLIKVYEPSPITKDGMKIGISDGQIDSIGASREVIDDREYLDSAKRSVIEYEYAIDTGLLKELREHEKQVAQEMGQWKERRELTGKDGGPIQTEGRGEPLNYDAFARAWAEQRSLVAGRMGPSDADDPPQPLDSA